MSVLARRLLGGGVLAIVVLSATMAASTLVTADSHQKYRGEFGAYFPTPSLEFNAAHDPGVTGQAKMKIGLTDTKVSVELMGLNPDLVYGSHLHNGRCADGGGGHYQDLEGGPVDSINEIWLSSFDLGSGILAVGGKPVASASGSADWVARTSGDATKALSVVVHAPGGARIACADLELEEQRSQGNKNR